MASLLSSGDICELCCEDFNKTTRSKINCPACDYPVCRQCTRKYLLNTTELPHCLNCKTRWELDVLINATLKSYVNKDYRDHRKVLLFEHEKSRMPETMPEVENYKKVNELSSKSKDLTSEINNLKTLIRQKENERYSINIKIRQYKNGEVATEKREFKRKCPNEKCLGFLSTQWKCGICNTKVCSKCFAIKDPDIEHECNDDDIKSAESIKKETRNCPTCGTSIYKIDGCFEKGTKILLWNSQEKSVENIVKGDILIGTDGNKRTVLETANGYDNLYKIIQNNGINYTVNSKHQLILKPSYFKKYKVYNNFIKIWWFDLNKVEFKSKQVKYTNHNFDEKMEYVNNFMNSIKEDNLKITVDDYLKLKKSTKSRLYGFKSTKVNWKYQDITIDPYILGTWLGDGYSDGSGISGKDKEIIEKWMEWCENNDGELVHTAPYRFSVRRKGSGYKRGAIGQESNCKICELNKFELCDVKKDYVKNKKGRNSTSPMKNALKKYNLLNNKHIPDNYLMNSEENRIKLLAGIIDTDGCVTNNGKRITIIQVNEKLSKQICILAKSLGFVVNMNLRQKLNVKVPGCIERKDYKLQYNINISGENLSKIPTILKRKKCIDSNPNKDYFKSLIKIEHQSYDQYYGFKVDQDNTFILPDFTSVKNCDQMWCTQCHTAFSWKTGHKINGVIHNPHFFQWQNNGGGEAPVNAPGVQMCGGLPYWYDYRGKVRNFITHNIIENKKVSSSSNIDSDKLLRNLSNLYRQIVHFNNVELERLRRSCNNINDNKLLRIKYMVGELDENNFKTKILSRDRQHSKLRAILEIYELIHVVVNETLRDIYETCNEKINNNKFQSSESAFQYILDKFSRIKKVREYANTELIKISVLYSQNVGIITKYFTTVNLKFNKKEVTYVNKCKDIDEYLLKLTEQ